MLKMLQWFLQHVVGNCNGIFFSDVVQPAILMLPVHHTSSSAGFSDYRCNQPLNSSADFSDYGCNQAASLSADYCWLSHEGQSVSCLLGLSHGHGFDQLVPPKAKPWMVAARG